MSNDDNDIVNVVHAWYTDLSSYIGNIDLNIFRKCYGEAIVFLFII